jgi:hypothetical protein
VTIKGTCLCGSAKYEVKGDLPDAGNCHCSMCRKAHGAAFTTYASVDPDNFSWVTGEDLVSFYEASPGACRMFCSVCGSILGATDNGRVISVTLGTIDGDPGIKPRSNIFVGSKAPWHDITDDLPRFDEWPPGEGWA